MVLGASYLHARFHLGGFSGSNAKSQCIHELPPPSSLPPPPPPPPTHTHTHTCSVDLTNPTTQKPIKEGKNAETTYHFTVTGQAPVGTLCSRLVALATSSRRLLPETGSRLCAPDALVIKPGLTHPIVFWVERAQGNVFCFLSFCVQPCIIS